MCHATGSRRPKRCIQTQVIFRKRATNYRALLRKMTCADKASYGSSQLCTAIHVYVCTYVRVNWIDDCFYYLKQ